MESPMDKCNETTPSQPRNRPSSISSIPRPTSGTSRRVTPLRGHASTPKSIEGNTGVRLSTGQPRSFLVNDGNPPSSFRPSKPRMSLPSFTSDRGQILRRESHDKIHPLQSKNNSNRSSFSSASPTQVSPIILSTQGHKPITSCSAGRTFLTHNDYSKTRQLMKPLDPPFPLHQNLCLSQYSSQPPTESPLRNPLQISQFLGEEKQQTPFFSGNPARAVGGNSKKVKEKELQYDGTFGEFSDDLKTKQLRAETNQELCIQKTRSDKVTCSAMKDGSLNVIVTPPDSKISATRHVGKLSVTKQEVYPHLNQCGARNSKQSAHAFAIKSADSISTATDGEEEDSETNSKHVYVEESTAYWAGRYVALHDRARTEALNAIVQGLSTSPRSSLSSDGWSERSEFQLMTDTLEKLRDLCMTRKALLSFEKFEIVLKMNSFIQKPCPSKSVNSDNFRSNNHRESYMIPKSGGQEGFQEHVSQSHVISGKPARRLSSLRFGTKPQVAMMANMGSKPFSTDNITEKLSETDLEHPSQVPLRDETKLRRDIKQHSLLPLNQEDLDSRLISSSTDSDSPLTMKQSDHPPKLFYDGLKPTTEAARFKEADKSMLQRMRSQKPRDASRRPEVPTGRPFIVSLDPPMPDARYIEPGSAYFLSPRQAPSYPEGRQMSGSSEAKDNSTEVNMTEMRSKGERHGSGEFVKNIFGAGIREVRKMGKRVGSMSWGVLEEDTASKLRASGKS